MLRIRSFRRRVFFAILAVALVPTGLAILGGTLMLQSIGSGSGTLGPWDAVAASGRELIEAARAAAPQDLRVEAAADDHGQALSESVRRSRLYTVIAGRVVQLLPIAAILGSLILAGLSAWTARQLSRSFSGPIQALVGWTEHIARGEPLPSRAERGAGIREFDKLRRALRSMATELVQAREQEVEAARLRAWTEMSRRVAHELKNPLTPMRMSASALARSEDAATREAAEILLDEVGRLDEMARTFAQFGRLPEGPAADVDLVELLERLVERHDGHPVPVRCRIESPVPEVRGHHEVLARALRNLVVNAQEAVEQAGGGQVEVIASEAPGGARIIVRDEGVGIDPELLDRIWLPDVTTKRSGTGIGLALVLQAVQAHGGEAHASNRPQGGAQFEVFLPSDGGSLLETADPGTP